MIYKNNQLLFKKVVHHDTRLKMAHGLMFTKKITDTAHVFTFEKPRIADLHMLFVFYTIDVLCLNADFEVIDMKKNFKPFTFFFGKKSKYVVELPKNSISKFNIKLKDKIRIKK